MEEITSDTIIWSNSEEYIQILQKLPKERLIPFIMSGHTSDLAYIKRMILNNEPKENILEFINDAHSFDKEVRELLKQNHKGEN